MRVIETIFSSVPIYKKQIFLVYITKGSQREYSVVWGMMIDNIEMKVA